jgi:hypothetical protein
LDRLAAEKRAQALASGAVKTEPPSKRVKREPGEEDTDLAANGGVFKGTHISGLQNETLIKQYHRCQSNVRPLVKSRRKHPAVVLVYQKRPYDG